MAFVLPAIKAKLGTTAYYILSMKARDLIKHAVIPADTAGWDALSVEEKFQRELDVNRVKNQIAPYLANNNDRFFAAVILAAENFNDTGAFEPLSKFAKDLPGRLYADASEEIGFLTFKGGETFFVLDGQHRLEAIKYAITGKDRNGKNIAAIAAPCPDIKDEDITVILVKFQADKTRKVFMPINRYARPTSAGENITRDDNNIIAALTREIVGNGRGQIIPTRLVKHKNNTLSSTDKEFTTYSNIYNCNREILYADFPTGKKISETTLPDKKTQARYRDKVFGVWVQLSQSIDIFRRGLADPDNQAGGDEKRIATRKANLLGKPVAQECLVRAYLRLTRPPTNMPGEQACEKLNALPWPITDTNISQVWDRLLWSGNKNKGKILTKNRDLAARIIAYMAGEQLPKESKEALLQDYLNLFPEYDKSGKTLPKRLGD